MKCRSKKAVLRERAPKRWKQPEGEDRNEMKERSKSIEVHLAQRVDVEYREKKCV